MILLTGHLVISTLQVTHFLLMETVQVDVFQMFSTTILQGTHTSSPFQSLYQIIVADPSLSNTSITYTHDHCHISSHPTSFSIDVLMITPCVASTGAVPAPAPALSRTNTSTSSKSKKR